MFKYINENRIRNVLRGSLSAHPARKYDLVSLGNGVYGDVFWIAISDIFLQIFWRSSKLIELGLD